MYWKSSFIWIFLWINDWIRYFLARFFCVQFLSLIFIFWWKIIELLELINFEDKFVKELIFENFTLVLRFWRWRLWRLIRLKWLFLMTWEVLFRRHFWMLLIFGYNIKLVCLFAKGLGNVILIIIIIFMIIVIVL